ncbi:two-component system, OmpR family, response regulator TctD [Palleronia marisminoris]|uniref:Transcriptional regulatory protein tctD n=1 Tax=Palleronia marisminoris TaxID=315423 RepID=A0A1Y5SSY0_9RHOB|nr:response regulator transcription factor [Palleronia marisminoris]SFG93682.1 two-component system, OmpR family, response regulator TctD [Palleronia marisminoris]SLN45774.1 Transcriptional regulatory protein tctD [Palleronia marisminoris]
MRVLIVEDTRDVGEAVVTSLSRAGFACDLAGTLDDAEEALAVQAYDAIVLDINLPDGDGRDLLKGLRRSGNQIPVLMLTAEFEVTARVEALDGGADDYLVKPFDLRELEARLRVLLRRETGRADNAMTIGALAFDESGRTVRIDGAPVQMTRREMTLLSLMLAHRDQILSKERLFDGLFSFDRSEVGTNTVELYVARLRKKLAGSRVKIETHRGLGYRLVAEDG